MKVVGLVGGIAAGKSSAAEYFLKHKIPVFCADQVVKDLYSFDKGVRVELKKICPQVFLDNKLDWGMLREYALSSAKNLSSLENLLHPFVRKLMLDFLDEHRALKTKIVILDVPLLLETNGWEICDAIIWLKADLELRIQRALSRKTLNRSQLDMIVSKQSNDADRSRVATYTVDSSKSLEDLEESISLVVEKLEE